MPGRHECADVDVDAKEEALITAMDTSFPQKGSSCVNLSDLYTRVASPNGWGWIQIDGTVDVLSIVPFRIVRTNLVSWSTNFTPGPGSSWATCVVLIMQGGEARQVLCLKIC